jgi:penicillin-binding protein 1C
MTGRWLLALVIAALAGAGGVGGFDLWVRSATLPALAPPTGQVVVDRDGRLLRAWAVEDGLWRLPVTLAEVDPLFLVRLIAYEDRRFRDHAGVDALALVRAGVQALASGRIVSGGSTLTMQVARLLERSGTGGIRGKLRQIRLALRLERRLSKDEVLALYLRLAPYGGTLEGVRAASLAWFGKEPRRLTPAEAALLVALPQAPEARRPDRHPAAARAARDRVLMLLARRGALDAEEAAAALREASPLERRAFPILAPHLADRLRAAAPDMPVIATTLDAALEARLEALLLERVQALDPALSAALIVADHRTGEILARVGAPDLFDTRRRGFIDMTRAVRSPGSLLKPLIYGLAFEDGLAHPETLIEDRPMRFGGWEPQNFDRSWRGTIRLATALQLSLNVPAIALLDAVGPAALLARLRRAGAEPRLPPGGLPGLAVGLGGIGLTLEELVAVFAAIARGGEAVALRETPALAPPGPPAVLLAPDAAWQVAEVLAGVAPPASAAFGRLAYKTGTSYGHRDAWAIGFDGRHVIGVWLGRADATAMPGILGAGLAAPILFEAFSRLKTRPEPLPPPPPSVLTVSNAELPPPLRRFRPRGAETLPGDGPEIVFPPQGAEIELGLALGTGAALTIRLRNGVPPFTWLVDGAPIAADPWAREAVWTPAGPGYAVLTVVDALGQAARSAVAVR